MGTKKMSIGQLVNEVKTRLESIKGLDHRFRTISEQNINDQKVGISLDSFNTVLIADRITKDIVKRSAKSQLKNLILERMKEIDILNKELQERIGGIYGR